MEFTKERLNDMDEKRKNTFKHAKWLEKLKHGDSGKTQQSQYPEEFERMLGCLNFWEWDLYERNKIMDLKRVNRCKARYCPNCRSVALAKNIMEFAPYYMKMRKKGYTPYLLTLTQPNCSDENLISELNRMSKGFTKFWYWFNANTVKSRGNKNRMFNIVGAIKFLEVNRKKVDQKHRLKPREQWCHPHQHLIIFLDGTEDEMDFMKNIPAEYSYKKKEQNYISLADIHVREMWYRAFNGLKVNEEITDSYMCDIVEMDSKKGIYEVFKYCVKDTDLDSYESFEVIYNGLYKRRLRQGYGELFNMKLDEEGEEKEKEDTIVQYLLTDESELPQTLFTEFQKLFSIEYHDYKKISRFKTEEIMENLKE